ncbi:hypothetical protein Pan216_16190 [Planctomycetes bacterium Pan216]|uniref:Helix-turn-helix domain protein n=1 Tax=Kolteria novifilia TaxID=2527975 RepID=A0A518B1B4_9BACT|nr:hypothetical protein Pan216_16190 [Planctomycetes bacterium Pan216]
MSTGTPTLVPQILVDLKDAADLLSISPTTLKVMDAGGRVPAPVYLGRCKRWRVADLERWVKYGCPDRAEFRARWMAEAHSES